jgi:hypothetical protein
MLNKIFKAPLRRIAAFRPLKRLNHELEIVPAAKYSKESCGRLLVVTRAVLHFLPVLFCPLGHRKDFPGLTALTQY